MTTDEELLSARDDLRVGPLRQRRVRRELVRIFDHRDRAVQPALSHRRGDREVAKHGLALGARVEDVGLDVERITGFDVVRRLDRQERVCKVRRT